MHSIAFKLLGYFVVSGGLLFGILLLIFLLISEKFAELAVKDSTRGLTHEMASSLSQDTNGHFVFDDSELKLKWGFDALYSNLAYRLVEIESNQAVLYSKPLSTPGYLFNRIEIDIPSGYTWSERRNLSLYRMKLELNNNAYYFDVARSDLLGALANEAVEPAIVDVASWIIGAAFLLFIVVSLLGVKLIVKPANALSKEIEGIKPDDLEKRLDTSNLPRELFPIANAMNQALSRVEKGFALQQRFIADAAHELRTPLAILLNRIELKLPASPQKQALEKDAKFISRIVEQLLDLSRAQSRDDKPIAPIALAQVVKDVCLLLAPLAIDKGQELELEVSDEEKVIAVDEGELAIVVKNLLENAIKHTPQGSKILVSTTPKQITVEDSGPGIPEDAWEHVFERFWRVNQSDRSGSGLGLSITKTILEHYQGDIDVDNQSRLGGARFRVRFC